MKVGFIGLGTMGKGMVANLAKAGHSLVVHDLTKAAAEATRTRASSTTRTINPGRWAFSTAGTW